MVAYNLITSISFLGDFSSIYRAEPNKALDANQRLAHSRILDHQVQRRIVGIGLLFSLISPLVGQLFR